MKAERLARLERLVDLRQQQRRQEEVRHAQARLALEDASTRQERCAKVCESLDREREEALSSEIDPVEMDSLYQARTAAGQTFDEATVAVCEAEREAEARREVLLEAHRRQRSLELYHERLHALQTLERSREEQRNLDEVALQSRNRGIE
jgi:flagellar export protein FliJ